MALMTTPVLAQPDWVGAVDGTAPLVLDTDASTYALGGVLSQDTSCCAPAERCNTAQDGLGDDGSQVKIKLHYAHQVHQMNTGYIAGWAH